MAREQRGVQLPELHFSSPHAREAVINPKCEVVCGEIRKGAPEMCGVFSKGTFREGEFICTWNGINYLLPSKQAELAFTQSLSNYFDLQQYWIDFAQKNTDNQPFPKVISCPPLTADGKPVKPSDSAGDHRYDHEETMALFLNEPAYGYIVKKEDDSIIFEKVTDHPGPNVCLLPDICSNALVLYAKRDIKPGEELTWMYGGDYKRDIYAFDYDEKTYKVVGKYKTPASDANSKCIHSEFLTKKIQKVSFDTPSLLRKYPRDFDANAFVASNPMHRKSDALEKMHLRSEIYAEYLSKQEEEERIRQEPKIMKRKEIRQSVREDSLIDSQVNRIETDYKYYAERIGMTYIEAMDALARSTQRVQDKKFSKMSDATKARFERIPAIKDYLSVNGIQPNSPFSISTHEMKEFANGNDHNVKVLLKMMLGFWNLVKEVHQNWVRDSKAIFSPETYLKLYKRNLCGKALKEETLDAWLDATFETQYPAAFKYGKRFFAGLRELNDIVSIATIPTPVAGTSSALVDTRRELEAVQEDPIDEFMRVHIYETLPRASPEAQRRLAEKLQEALTHIKQHYLKDTPAASDSLSSFDEVSSETLETAAASSVVSHGGEKRKRKESVQPAETSLFASDGSSSDSAGSSSDASSSSSAALVDESSEALVGGKRKREDDFEKIAKTLVGFLPNCPAKK